MNMSLLDKVQWGAIADKADQLFASFARPYIAIICGTGVAGACFVPASAPIAIPVAGAIVGGFMAVRTIEKNAVVKADVENKKTDAGITPPATTGGAS